jgi:hypothetical protein
MSCHPLEFDTRFKDPAPHKEPKIVQAYLIDQYTKYIAQHPGEVHERVQLNPASCPTPCPPPAPNNAAEWVAQRVEEAERLLFQKDCKECHQLTYPAPSSRRTCPRRTSTDSLDEQRVVRPQGPPTGGLHRVPHRSARKSQKTEDVLLPGIATCQKCHNPSGKNAAVSQCYECHVYHDWSKAKPIKSTTPSPSDQPERVWWVTR